MRDIEQEEREDKASNIIKGLEILSQYPGIDVHTSTNAISVSSELLPDHLPLDQIDEEQVARLRSCNWLFSEECKFWMFFTD